ncbi:expressed unknown protein [Seminavis robusta]|uniref:Uncharacterized protein n=1 Tax=Seminavis robusta TaxID=568900 RepID=A0A9N8EGI0_9STRA|nr:expressed unknown protein [Seminavis robusta]|eukprot:Sro1093_g240410.1 n/a (370) ;mRNA; f:26291-27400
MNCHYHEFGGSSSGGGSRGNRAMSEIAIAHDMNQPLSTSYHYSSSATPQEIQKKQYKAEMAKATAITKQYSHIISSSPPPANKTTTSTYTNANQQSPPSTTRPNLRPRRTSAEPGGLALSGSFRSKSLSSLASSTDDNNNGSTTQAIGNGSDHSHAGDEVAAAAAATTPPPLKTDVTDLLLTPKLSPPAQDPSMPTNGNNMTPPEWNAQVTDIVSNPPLKMPAKKPPSTRSLHSQQQERRQRHSFQLAPAAADPTSYQQQPQPRRVSDSMALNYSTNSAFQSGTYNSASSPARRRLSPVYNIHDSTPQQRRPSGTLALEEQARMLSQMQQSQPQHAPTKVNSETLAFEEQARMLSQMQQQQQQHHNMPL